MLDYCTSDTIFMRPLCLKPAAVQICPYVLNGALLLEHNVALYLERCSESVGSIHMDHCLCNAPRIICLVMMLTVTCDLENLFSKSYFHDEYLRQVSLESLY